MTHHTLVTKENDSITLTIERTWRAVLGLGEGFHIHCADCLSISTLCKKNSRLRYPSHCFLISFLRRLLEGEVLDRSQRVAPSARQLAAAERISLRRDACLNFPLK